MFYLNDSFLKQRFEVFEKKDGLLPDIKIKCETFLNQKSHLKSVKILGDYTFYESDTNGFFFSISDTYLLMSTNFKENKLLKSNNSDYDLHICTNLLMMSYMYRLIDTGNFMIHAAAVVYENQGILFCGMSGAGKSTQANLWKKYLNAWVLNYDKPCVIKKNDMYYVHGSPWSGKEDLFLNEYVPLKAIVFVKQAKENRVTRLSYGEAYSNVYLHNYVYPLTIDIEEKYSEIIKNTIYRIPTYELFCDISEKAVEVLCNELFTNMPYYKSKKERSMKYKIRDCFQMKQIADEFIVVPRGEEALDFSATLVFNETGAFLWDKLLNYIDIDDLADSLAEKYELNIENAKLDVVSFIEKLQSNGLLSHD